MKPIEKIYIWVLIIILLLVLVSYIYLYFKPKYIKSPVMLMKEKTVVNKDFNLFFQPSEIEIPEVDLDKSLNTGTGITIGFNIYLANAMENEGWGSRFDQLKTIINFPPNISYNPAENYFEFSVKIKDNIGIETFQTIKLDEIPLQRWLSVIVVYNSNRINVYIDGELKLSKKLKNPIIFRKNVLNIGETNNNIIGGLGNVMYWSYPLSEKEINYATIDLLNK